MLLLGYNDTLPSAWKKTKFSELHVNVIYKVFVHKTSIVCIIYDQF